LPYLAAFSIEVAEQLVEILPLDARDAFLSPVPVDGDFLVKPFRPPLHRLERRPTSVRPAPRAAADGASAGEMVVHLPPHRARFAHHGGGQVAAPGGGGVGDDGERRLQRMGEIAGVAARFLGLLLIVSEQRVHFLGERRDLARQAFVDARLGPGSDRDDRAAHPPQRPQAVNRLQRGQHDQAERKDAEGAHQRAAQHPDLLVELLAILRDLEAPKHRRAGQADVALGNAEHFGRGGAVEFAAVGERNLAFRHRPVRHQLPVPQRTGRKRLVPRPISEVEPRIASRKRWSAGWRFSNMSPSEPISDVAISAVSTYSRPASKLRVMAETSTRSSV
jgi:hypothetical protein